VSLSLDDFGQGVSSLARLNLFDVDELKIDRRFVSRIINHGRDVGIVDLVVALADRLGLRLVAEGVERVPRVERSTPMAQPAAALSDTC
jgi:EAL domain-containing protein (putative c-di-GMP-specific phosphodiesterase class I)